MILALFTLALADDAPSAGDIADCGPSVEFLYPRDGATSVAVDAVPTVLIASPECGGLALELVLVADGAVVAQRSVDTDSHLVELDAALVADTEYQFLVYEGGRDTTSDEAWFTTGSAAASPPAATPSILAGEAVMGDESGAVYVAVSIAPVADATVVGAAPWDGASDAGDPTDVADAAEERYLRASMLGPQVGEEACIAVTARGLDGTWSDASTACFVVTQGWDDEGETWVDDHDHACNAASAAMGLAPILLGTLGILRRRAR